MKRLLLSLSLILFLSNAIVSFAGSYTYMDYDWDKSPKVYELSASEKLLPEIIVKQKEAVEFFINNEGGLEELELFHKITKVNSDQSIESNNRIYIPTGSAIKFYKLKARVITPNGKVVELNEKDIKEGIDEKTKQGYKYFAVEGIVLGSEIEILFLMQRPPSYTGSTERVQSDILKKQVEFEIISPKNLIFVAKSYNGLPEFKTDTLNKEKNVLYLKLDKVEPVSEEKISTYYANLQQFVYRISGNTDSNVKNIITYGKIATNVYGLMMAPSPAAIDKKIKKLIQAANIKYARDDEDKIRIIEQYIKRNFAILDNSERGPSELDVILDKRVTSNEGVVHLFAAIFNYLQIDYQIILTSNRERLKFDPQFEAYNFLGEYLIYIPSVNKYLCPDNAFSSLGFVPYNLTNNYGLFIKKVKVGDYSSAVGKIQFIDPLPYDKTFSNIDVSVDFSSDILKPKCKAEHQYGGYYAQHYQPIFSFINDEDKKKITDEILENYIPNLKDVDARTENAGMEYFGISPFIVKASFISETLVEKAGDNYLFKVGDLIGPQAEMYQKEERKMDIENDYNRNYHREITFELPTGYKLSNPEILNMDKYFEENGDRIIGFTSKYTMEGRQVKIIIDEYYKKIVLPVSQYEDFRRVINAAADFNKLTLLLEKSN